MDGGEEGSIDSSYVKEVALKIISRVFPRGPQRPRYNEVAVYWEFLLLKIERVSSKFLL